jgi:hypothetical protein
MANSQKVLIILPPVWYVYNVKMICYCVREIKCMPYPGSGHE